MNSHTSPPTETQQAQESHNYLAGVFARRLTLTQVAQVMIQEWFDDLFAGSNLRASACWIGVIQQTGSHRGATYNQLVPLSDALIQCRMVGKVLNYTSGHHQLLVNTAGDEFKPADKAISVDDIEFMLNALAPRLLDGFWSRLVEYWNARVPDDSSLSRWHAVGRHLRLCLRKARQNPPLTSAQQKMFLSDDPEQLWGDRQDRQVVGETNRLWIYQVYAAHEGQLGEWLPMLVLKRDVDQETVILLYIPAMNVVRLGTLDDLGALLPRYMRDYKPGIAIKWVLKEPAGNAFDALAQTLLDGQLRSLKKVDWSELPEVASYVGVFHKLTSPLVWFDSERVGQPNEEQLPLWLQAAGAADRQAYGQWCARLADLQRRTGGASFLDGLEPIDVYARKKLQQQMLIDFPEKGGLNPDDYLLTVKRTQGSTIGWTQSTTRTLTLWSLENPYATPYASIDIVNQADPGNVPVWLTQGDYLNKLMAAVDVGKHYPVLLKDKLYLDAAESARRRRLFRDQMMLQLPMLALEYSLVRSNGFTRQGYNVVQAMMRTDHALRRVADEVIVARPLGFLAHAGGTVHTAANLFVIGPRDNGHLPHVLYRPDHAAVVLEQFPSRQALLDEVARTGSDLQHLVLERFSERSRAIFDNGGFLNPRFQRVLPGDEFSVLPASSPALLCDETVPGEFLDVVFDQNARSLWQSAEKQSVSNEALRWTLFRNNLWQLFNAVLPMLRGPVATAGWLLQISASFRAVLALPSDASQEARADMMAELIGSLSGLLMSPVVMLEERLGLMGVEPDIRWTGGGEAIAPVHSRQSVSTFDWHSAMADVTIVDSSWANATLRLNAAQRAQLATFQWSPRAGESRPTNPAILSKNSPVRGRVVLQHTSGIRSHADYTLINSKLYGVKQLDGRWRIVDLRNDERLGPWLRRNPRGVWGIDLGMQLRGGQPKPTPAELRANIQRNNQILGRNYNDATTRLMEAERPVVAAHELYKKAFETNQSAFTDLLRENIRARYLIELKKQNRCQREKLDLLIAKNANRPLPGFEQENILQLEALIENMREQMSVLKTARAALALSSERKQQLRAQLVDEDVSVAEFAHQTLRTQGLKTAELNDQLIELSILERNNREQMTAIPGYDLESSLLSAAPSTTPLDWKSRQLEVYRGLILNRRPFAEEFEDFVHLSHMIEQLSVTAGSQKILEPPSPISLEQRITGLKDNLREYETAQAWLRGADWASSGLLDPDYIQRLYRLINSIEHEAQRLLAIALREQNREKFSGPGPRRRPALDSDKRLVRDQKNRYMVGLLRTGAPGSTEEIVDVIEPVDKLILASFRRDGSSSEFESVANVTPAVSRPVRSLEKLLADAQRLLGRATLNIDQARIEAQTSTVPEQVEAGLVRKANAMNAVADKIRKAMALGENPDADSADITSQRLLTLEQAVGRLIEQGRLIRIEMTKRLPPVAEGIEYLKSQGEIEILSIQGRIKLKRENDYLQEYMIQDKAGAVLGYAHFHYSAQDSPDTPYTAGHLKKLQERFLSFQSLADVSDSRAIDIYYSKIGERLARQLFFNATGSIVRRARRQYW
ncbi:hypothetical protein OOJ96_01815 [Pseudomonas sp. 15FMM2]|uniref:Uncharacterized protein n=1 Tax=Pseudomonas imrae TaxID=2992837 RepID=A0ACC7P794_9PSED